MRIFANFGDGTPAGIAWLNATIDMADGSYNSSGPAVSDLSFSALEYMLAVTMEQPSLKDSALERYCGGSIPEEMFLHFAADTNVSLHLHHEMVDE